MTSRLPAAGMPELIREVVGDEQLVRAVFSGPRSSDSPWKRLVARHIELRGEPHLQLNWYTAKKCETRNYGPRDARPTEEIVAADFRNAHVELAGSTIDARTSKRGKLLMTRKATENSADPRHDRVRSRLIPETAAFLEVLGMAVDGRVKPNSQRKYRQINEFLRTVESTVAPACDTGPATFQVVDFGCGNAYLTFATYYFLTEVKGLRCTVTGVDRNAEAVRRNIDRAAALGWAGQLTFVDSDIDRYVPDRAPDLILSLHSCDTATDAALAAGVRWGSRFILASPCCHHHIQKQLRPDQVPPGFAEILRDGILREQFGDVLTDALRAARLRVAGYAVDVMAFVPLEETARNVLIRAVRQHRPDATQSARNYADLTGSFHVEPYIGSLLDE